MSKKLKTLIILFMIVFICSALYLIFFSYEISASNFINKQLNSIIKNNDTYFIKKVSYDNETYNFLINLPKNAKCQKTSDSQGSSKSEMTSYYLTLINNHSVGVTIKQLNTSNIFPKWEIVNIRKWK